jgi:DNA-binding IclR family transcriptional regulator
VQAAVLARDLGLPRSTTYHLLRELISAGFVVHLPEERRFGLGVSAFEIGTAYLRQEPLARLARPVLGRLVDAVGESAHLAVLHGREVLYVVEERAPGRMPLVTDVGVRLPAELTASGRAVLAGLPAAQVRALFPDATAFVDRHGAGPRTLSALRRLLVDVRRVGYASEEGEVTPGLASVDRVRARRYACRRPARRASSRDRRSLVDVGVLVQHPRLGDLGDVDAQAGLSGDAFAGELADPLCQRAPVQDQQARVDSLVRALPGVRPCVERRPLVRHGVGVEDGQRDLGPAFEELGVPGSRPGEPVEAVQAVGCEPDRRGPRGADCIRRRQDCVARGVEDGPRVGVVVGLRQRSSSGKRLL